MADTSRADELKAGLTAIQTDADLPDLLENLGEAMRVVGARLRHEQATRPEKPLKPTHQPDRLLTVQEAAEVLGVNVRWVYRRSKVLPFVVPLSRRVLRFSEAGLQKWLKAQRGRRG